MALRIALVLIVFSRLPSDAQNTRITRGTITGVVKNPAGDAVAGALVKVRSDQLGLGVMVVSQAQGRFNSPDLLPGDYAVQAFGGGTQSAPIGPIKIANGQQGSVDVVLSTPLFIPPRERRMTEAEYKKLLPEGDVKEIVAGQCGLCHSFLEVVSARKTLKQWQESYDRMLDDVYDLRKLMIYHQAPDDSEAAKVLAYLAKNFGPEIPPDPRVVKQWLLRPDGPSHTGRNLPANLLQGAAAKYFAVEFSLPPGSKPRDVAVDSQGIAWVSESGTGLLGRFDPDSLTYTRAAPPAGKNAKAELNAIAVDSSDQVWFADDGPNARILRYDPKSREFMGYPIPEYRFPAPEEGWARIQTLRFVDGNVWATGITSNRILRLDPGTRRMIDYSVPKGSVAFGLAIGTEDSIWCTELMPNQVLKLDPKSGRLTKYYVPVQEPDRADARGIAADSEGNLWVAATEPGKLLKLDSRTGGFTEYTPPTHDPGPYSVDVDIKRNLIWFSEIYSDRIGRYDPRTNTFVEYPHPDSDSDVRRIEVDRSHPNRVWWSSFRNDKIGYIEVIE